MELKLLVPELVAMGAWAEGEGNWAGGLVRGGWSVFAGREVGGVVGLPTPRIK